MSVGLSLGERRWRLIRRVDTIKAWFADTGRDGLYVDGRAGEALFQDAARTQPAAIGDPVGGLLDLSGNGYHGSQTTPAARPLRTVDGLAYDGVDDSIGFGNVLSFGTGSFTLLALCGTTDNGQRDTLFAKRRPIGPGDSAGYAMRILEDSRLYFSIDDGVTGKSLVFSDTIGKTYGLHLLVIVVDRGANTVYARVDGVASGQGGIAGIGDISGVEPLDIGGVSGPFKLQGEHRAGVIMAGTDYQVVEQALLARLP